MECKGKINRGTAAEEVCTGHYDLSTGTDMKEYLKWLDKHIRHGKMPNEIDEPQVGEFESYFN